MLPTICFYYFISFLFSLLIIINNNIISCSGGQLDGPMAFMAACPYIIFICYFMYFWEIKKDACLRTIYFSLISYLDVVITVDIYWWWTVACGRDEWCWREHDVTAEVVQKVTA